jgi:DNA-binding transcriptional ArsR family regulator
MGLRAALEATLVERPGCTRSDLARHHQVTWHAAAHHVDRLIDVGLVRELRQGSRRHLFHVRHRDDLAAQTLARAPPLADPILDALAQPRRIAELATALQAGRKAVAAALAALRMHGLVALRPDGRYVRVQRPHALRAGPGLHP